MHLARFIPSIVYTHSTQHINNCTMHKWAGSSKLCCCIGTFVVFNIQNIHDVPCRLCIYWCLPYNCTAAAAGFAACYCCYWCCFIHFFSFVQFRFVSYTLCLLFNSIIKQFYDFTNTHDSWRYTCTVCIYCVAYLNTNTIEDQ